MSDDKPNNIKRYIYWAEESPPSLMGSDGIRIDLIGTTLTRAEDTKRVEKELDELKQRRKNDQCTINELKEACEYWRKKNNLKEELRLTTMAANVEADEADKGRSKIASLIKTIEDLHKLHAETYRLVVDKLSEKCSEIQELKEEKIKLMNMVGNLFEIDHVSASALATLKNYLRKE